MSKYETLDSSILNAIGGAPKLSGAIMAGKVRRECERVAREELEADQRSRATAYRVLDRRLQALKRAGKIKAKINVGWTRVDATVVDREAVPA